MKLITIQIREVNARLTYGQFPGRSNFVVERIKDGKRFGNKQHAKFFTTFKLANEYSLWLEDFYNCLGIPTTRVKRAVL